MKYLLVISYQNYLSQLSITKNHNHPPKKSQNSPTIIQQLSHSWWFVSTSSLLDLPIFPSSHLPAGGSNRNVSAAWWSSPCRPRRCTRSIACAWIVFRCSSTPRSLKMPWSLGEDFGCFGTCHISKAFPLETNHFFGVLSWKPPYIKYINCLLGGLEHQIGFFPYIWEFLIIPTDELIFFGGVAKKHHPVF